MVPLLLSSSSAQGKENENSGLNSLLRVIMPKPGMHIRLGSRDTQSSSVAGVRLVTSGSFPCELRDLVQGT